ncbi:hypothetical protein CFOL_v3_11572 [Cephalotus follicularis]|uniref:Uncharacterized protein n=1 Tax=Cephalotus follicularis TaxID=3775 RepID=A0A1Q3BJJ2_CEPFO|nr:hypothetical protein CFOL_v3_11572 [Cephalotus follicularis]
MAITTTCCLNIPPPAPASNSAPCNPMATHVAWHRNEKWRSQCVVGMASIIIGLEMGDFVSCVGSAIAKDIPSIVGSNDKVLRWSEKRVCPSWHLNTLETIVPENLPRPSAHRRWEAVGFTKNAPPVKVTVKSSSSCFSM